jgi:hypothetical protein
MNTTDLTSDVGLTDDSPSPDSTLQPLDPSTSGGAAEFIRPTSFIWKLNNGREIQLWPLCNGGEILFQQVLYPGDTNVTCILIWIFLYHRRKIEVSIQDAKSETGYKIASRPARDSVEDFETNVVELASDRKKFRGAFLRWLDSLGLINIADKQAAVKIFDDAHAFARKSEVAPVPDVSQKKTPVSRRRTSHS